jgi:hypothetical protein
MLDSVREQVMLRWGTLMAPGPQYEAAGERADRLRTHSKHVAPLAEHRAGWQAA